MGWDEDEMVKNNGIGVDQLESMVLGIGWDISICSGLEMGYDRGEFELRSTKEMGSMVLGIG